MRRGHRFFKIYFILAIIFAIIGILEYLFYFGTELIFGEINIIWSSIMFLFNFGMVLLSIYALINFIENKFAKITLVIPIYHIITIISIFLFFFAWGIIMGMQGVPAAEQTVSSSLLTVQILGSSFELIFSIYILYKFRKMIK